MSVEYTTVVGLDKKHLKQMAMVWPTWKRHKPSLLKQPMMVFYDHTQIDRIDIISIIDHPDLRIQHWPPASLKIEYPGDPGDKWSSPSRHKAFAGFIYMAEKFVETKYWLKMDTDAVGVGQDDWIDDDWFTNGPALVGHRWGFTKPENQMLLLDEWVKSNNIHPLNERPPLNLVPTLGSDRVSHPRVEGWCLFVSTKLTSIVSACCRQSCGYGLLPVALCDGLLWYCAKRLEFDIVRTNMKNCGWQLWSTNENIRKHAEAALRTA